MKASVQGTNRTFQDNLAEKEPFVTFKSQRKPAAVREKQSQRSKFLKNANYN